MQNNVVSNSLDSVDTRGHGSEFTNGLDGRLFRQRAHCSGTGWHGLPAHSCGSDRVP